MGDIYTEQGITQTHTAHIGEMTTGPDVRRAGKIFDAIADNAEEKAQKHQKLANYLYEGGSNLAIHNGLEQMSNDPAFASNPEAFAKEADKMASKVYGDIQNPEIKANVILNYELKKSSYVNRAYANMYKQQNEELEYQTLSGIQESMDSVGTSLENIMTGTMGADDLMTVANSNDVLEKYLSAKDVNGFNIFTPNQKMQIKNRFNQNVLERLKGGYLQLPVHKRHQIVDTLKQDEFGVSFEDGTGLSTSKDIKDMLPTESYLDFKDYVLQLHKRASDLAGGDDEITPELQELADTQLTNSRVINSELKTINSVKKEKPVEGVIRNLELQDNIQGMGELGLSKSDRKKYIKESVDDLLEMVKNDPLKDLSKQEDIFDDAVFQESVMSVGLQAMKHDGKLGGAAWPDAMSVVMIRDFYAMLKEADIDPRATDSGSRARAKDLAAKAISNTIERVAGGYGKEFNSMFMYGRKVSKQPIKKEEKAGGIVNTDYIINNGKKRYNDTGIEVDL